MSRLTWFGIGERPVHDEAAAEPRSQPRDAVVFGVEFGERDAVLSAAGGRQGVLRLLRRQRPDGDAGQAIVHVEGPVTALAELPVADDVDAGLDLLADDLLDRFLEAGLIGGFVVGLAVLDLAQEFDQFRRPHQAADMGGANAIDGAGHFLLLPLGGHAVDSSHNMAVGPSSASSFHGDL
jgi:hypothetical protein